MWMKDFPLCCGLAILVGLWREEKGEDEFSDPWVGENVNRWSRQKSDLYLFEKSYQSVVFGTIYDENDNDLTQGIPKDKKMVARLLLAALNAEGIPGIYAVFNDDQASQMRQFKTFGFREAAKTESIHGGTITSLIGEDAVIRDKLDKLYPNLSNWFPKGLSEDFRKQFCNQRRLFG